MGELNLFEDSQFGVLSLHAPDLWKRKHVLKIQGKQFELFISLQMDLSDGIESQQRSAFNFYVENEQQIHQDSQIQISKLARKFDNTGIGKSALPYSSTEIYFPYLREVPTFGIMYDVKWDPGHGVATKFESGKFVQIGPQDIVL